MTLFEKLIFVADYIEPNRAFEGVEEIRGVAYRDIDMACLCGIKHSMLYTVQKNDALYEKSILTYNALVEKIYGRSSS